MKVALVLYGFCRTFEHCKTSLQQHVLNVLNPDIYVNTPDITYAPPEHEIAELHHVFSKNLDKTTQTLSCLSNFNLKRLDARPYDSQFYKDYVDHHKMPEITSIGQRYWRVASTLHSISLAIKSFEQFVITNNLHYDLVIVTRPDVRYYRDFDTSVIELDKINYPACHMCEPDNPSMQHLPIEERKAIAPRIRPGGAGIFGYPGQWFNDQIICGNTSNIIQLGNVFSMADTYYREEVFFNTETYLGVHCMKNNISFVGTDFTTYELWRINQPEY